MNDKYNSYELQEQILIATRELNERIGICAASLTVLLFLGAYALYHFW